MDEAIAFVSECDLYVVLLGADFAAPMGSEWRAAQARRRITLAFSKKVARSPSAQWAHRQRGVEWTPFATPEELEPLLVRRLAQTLLEVGERLGLHLEDVERLMALLEATEQEESKPSDRRVGAGRSGVILGRPDRP